MENLTKERAHDLCVEMWNDIAENGYTRKGQSSLIKKYKPVDQCFACAYYVCDKCPFTKDGDDGCSEKDSPYYVWTIFKKRQHAIAIADLFIE